MTAVLAAILAAMLAAFLLALAGIPVLALLLQITWPIRRLMHQLRARIAVWRELDRSRARWAHPSVR